MVPMPAQKRKEAFHVPRAAPPSFGLRQSSGAFRSGPRAQNWQRTAAIQDAMQAIAPATLVREIKQLRGRAFVLEGGEQAQTLTKWHAKIEFNTGVHPTLVLITLTRRCRILAPVHFSQPQQNEKER